MSSTVVDNVVKIMKQPKVKKPKVKKKINYVTFVLDDSGSMGSLRNKAAESLNRLIGVVQEQSKKEKQTSYVSVLVFGNRVQWLYKNVLNGRHINSSEYSDGGGTPLYDAVGEAVKNSETTSRSSNPVNEDVSHLVVTLTDGDENQSGTYQSRARPRYGVKNYIEDLIKEKQNGGNYTFAFQGPRYSKDKIVREFGVPADNVTEWDQTEQGLRNTEICTSSSLGSYYGARSRGAKSVDNFYVTTDLSKVDVKKVHSKLDDLSNKFKVYDVPAEMPIKEFVESKTKKEYVIGQAYYQLTKKETVQGTKDVLVMEKGKKAIWGGDSARQLVGIPVGQTVKVTPGNHAGYDLYCTSTSVNRKLVRGTKVLVDVTMKKGLKPTWDHLAVQKQN